jgi:multiple sugar transport system permease protein
MVEVSTPQTLTPRASFWAQVAPKIATGRFAARALSRSAMWTLLLGFALISVIPMVWLILAPSKTPAELVSSAPLAFGSIENYLVAWEGIMRYQDGRFLQWVTNSAWYTALIVVFASSSAMLAGFALAVSPLPFKRTFLIVTFVAIMIPPVSLVLPLFVQVSAMGLLNSPWAIILTGSLFPFGTLLAYLYFSTSLPRSIYEAAALDGCGLWSTFIRIALPLSTALVGMLLFFSFTAAWLNFFLPYVLVYEGDKLPLHVGVGVLARGGGLSRSSIALAGLVTAIPVLVVFIASARMLSRGVFAGALKT